MRNKSPDEQVEIVNDQNEVIGVASRQTVRSRNMLHRGVAILVTNRNLAVYVHQRTATKDLFPSMFDMFVGGVVAPGESYEAAAKRELSEELGISECAPEFLFDHLYVGPENRSFIRVFQVQWDGPIRHQPEEVAWGDWKPRKELDAWVNQVVIVPDGLEVYRRMGLSGA